MKNNIWKVVLAIGAIVGLLLAIIFPKATWAYVIELLLGLAIIGVLAFNAKEKNNTVKVLLIVFIGLMILTWFIPAAVFSGEYQEQGRAQMGLFDVINYQLTSLSYFGNIALFIILVGGFYGILYKIPGYRAFLDKIVAIFKGKEELFLALLIVLNAILVSFCGLNIGIILFIPFIVALVLMIGYDKMTAAFVTVGSIAAGLIGTTFAGENVKVLVDALKLDFNYGIWVRIIILVMAIILVVFNTIVYSRKSISSAKVTKKAVKADSKVEVKKSTPKAKTTKKTTKTRKNNNKAALKEEDVIVAGNPEDEGYIPAQSGKGHSIWPIVCAFALLFVLLVMAFISWGEGGFGLKAFTNATQNVIKYELFGFPIFAKILGSVNAFGAWTITDMFIPMVLIVVILALIYKVSFEEVLIGFKNGAKKALAPAIVAILVYSILVLVTYHPFQLVIYNTLLQISKEFNIVTTVVISVLAAIFNVDITYTFQSVLPYYATQVTNLKDFSIVGIIFTSMYGLTMLFAPTSLILMGILSYLKVSYKDWLKNIWMLLLELFIILLIVFIIMALI